MYAPGATLEKTGTDGTAGLATCQRGAGARIKFMSTASVGDDATRKENSLPNGGEDGRRSLTDAEDERVKTPARLSSSGVREWERGKMGASGVSERVCARASVGPSLWGEVEATEGYGSRSAA
jgi:hypothetical protein